MRCAALVLLLAISPAVAMTPGGIPGVLPAGVLPDCLGDPALTVPVRAGADAVLQLPQGKAVLAGIVLPGAKFDPPSRWGAIAAVRMQELTRAPLMLYPAGDPDRYGRQPVQAVADGIWLQGDLIERGLARVDPASGACTTTLYAIEQSARLHHAGLWADPAYAVRPPEGALPGQFQIIEGRVLTVAKKDGRLFLNFGADWKTDFTVTVAPADMRRFRHAHLDPMTLAGRRVRVRGIVERYHGPEIVLAGPEGLEVLP
ncbi:MAG: thermonuclease family protein [Rhizomicrobium sp.]